MISDYEILTFMKQSDDPAFTPNEIADHFDLTNSAARRRLYNLVEDGKLGFKKPGHRTVLFWIAGDYSIDASET
ncbi:helix-turn-helix domain-containing protein [Halorubrum lacusprofundi]|jgi:predicted ArsR family transcriptional regulator|uniref:helix-turn-helix domain-containing protein n=1 Tax=Halorubrum lacusprofundi TaxID=2247 RepID=UPI0011318A13|nr:transcriptional regulator [Halorubrum lacusprofundi]MCG1008070.1 hypothetical protein [Halorubrum lacusprofundi]